MLRTNSRLFVSDHVKQTTEQVGYIFLNKTLNGGEKPGWGHLAKWLGRRENKGGCNKEQIVSKKLPTFNISHLVTC